MDEEELLLEITELSEEDASLEEEPVYRTYRMDFKNKRIIGMVDGVEAAAQAMFKALQTRRFAYLIYDDQYGCDIFNKIGNLNLTQSYLESDLPSMIEDTFLNEEMVRGINDLEFDIISGDSVAIQLAVSTIYGDATIEGAVSYTHLTLPTILLV